MKAIDKEKFGVFIQELRKEKGMTQKEMAERLFLSDKAVSKWERGQSLPDVGLLEPLADLLGVTVTELLRGERMGQGSLNMGEVEDLVASAVGFSNRDDLARQGRRQQFWRAAHVLSSVAGIFELVALHVAGFSWDELLQSVAVMVGLGALFGFWTCWMMREKLPDYYDENKISYYGDGIFRLHMAGLRFNNSNWPHIVAALRAYTVAMPVAFPVLWYVLRLPLEPLMGEMWSLPVTLVGALGLFIPIYVVGKKYE